MGCVLDTWSVNRSHSELVEEETTAKPALQGVIHVLLVSLDYKGTENELSASIDADHMEGLCRACQVQDLVRLRDKQVTRAVLEGTIAQMGARCRQGDTWIFYFAGHGDNVRDEKTLFGMPCLGDEIDGMDEALVLEDGNYLDDDMVVAITTGIPQGVRIIIMCDSCNSGTIADLGKYDWADREVVALSACTDTEEAGDTGTGGVFTHVVLLAAQQLQEGRVPGYSVARLYNEMLQQDKMHIMSAQQFVLSWRDVEPMEIPWPLVPRAKYTAPFQRELAKARKL